jgi:hypothetical protein
MPIEFARESFGKLYRASIVARWGTATGSRRDAGGRTGAGRAGRGQEKRKKPLELCLDV